MMITCLFPLCANAALIINNTRVIYNEADGESIVKLENKNDADNPILVQIWMDDGNAEADPSQLHVPFSVNPSIFKIEGKKSQSLRILKIDGIPNNDRETLYWINFLEIPKKNVANANENSMQLSIRNRLKFFYRPKDLSISIYDAYKKVTLAVTSSKPNYNVGIDNPTPYYMTFASVQIESADGKTIFASTNKRDDLMVAPFSKKNIELKTLKSAGSAATRINYSLINDFGSESKYIKE